MVVLPKIAVIGEVERALLLVHRASGGSPAAMSIDMSGCRFIEVATLQLIISTITLRARCKLRTDLRLPAGDDGLKVRHFLRRWGFAKAVHAASGIEFSKLVPAENLIYFRGTLHGGDPGDPYAGAMVVYNDRYGERIYRKEAYRFFGFQTWDIGSDTDRLLIVRQERERWIHAEPTVVETIRRQLSLPQNKTDEPNEREALTSEVHVADRIVLQAITNALRHPAATMIQASSHMAQSYVPDQHSVSGSSLSDSFFTIVYWDDGASMYKTLQRALRAGVPVSHPTVHNSSYLLKLEAEGHPDEFRMFSSSDLPDASSTDAHVLLSTLYPGVTCDLSGGGEFRQEALSGEPLTAVPGHGLFVLTQTAVNVFGGSVAFRTGRLFMNISKMSKQRWRSLARDGVMPEYYVKIRSTSDPIPEVLGNQVTIRLPLSGRVV